MPTSSSLLPWLGLSLLLIGGCGGPQTATAEAPEPPPVEDPAVDVEATPEQAEPDPEPAGPMGLDEAFERHLAGTVVFADVNSAYTREELGYIDGALLLSSYQFAPDELDGLRDATVVFYCVNPQCVASRLAAEYALSLGITQARHLPAGIMGWRDAAYPIAFPDERPPGEDHEL